MIVKRALLSLCLTGNLFALDSLTWDDGLIVTRAAVCATAACHGFEKIMSWRENSWAAELTTPDTQELKIDFGKKHTVSLWDIPVFVAGGASALSFTSDKHDLLMWPSIVFGLGSYALLKTMNIQRRINKASISIDIQEKSLSDAGAKANNDTKEEEIAKDTIIARKDLDALAVDRKILARLGQLRKYSATASLASLAAGACLLKFT